MKKSRIEAARTEAQLYALEEHLADTLKPFTPPTDLVARMRDRIWIPQREKIVLRIGSWKRLFLVYGGVMSGFLVIITVARAFFYFMRK